MNTSIWLIDETLTGTRTLIQSEPESNGNEGVCHHQMQSNVISRTVVLLIIGCECSSNINVTVTLNDFSSCLPQLSDHYSSVGYAFIDRQLPPSYLYSD